MVCCGLWAAADWFTEVHCSFDFLFTSNIFQGILFPARQKLTLFGTAFEQDSFLWENQISIANLLFVFYTSAKCSLVYQRGAHLN